MTNKAKAIAYINANMPLVKDDLGVVSTDREILIDFIKNPKDTALFGRYQANIYKDLAGMFDLPPIKQYDSESLIYILA